jgi:acyl-lipid omega-6 desaturase (Delta-12 desaturase)
MFLLSRSRSTTRGRRAVAWRYRLFRRPLVMFGLGPLLSVVIMPRLVPKDLRPRLRRSIIRTNVAVGVAVVALCLLMGWWQYLIVQWPVAWLASSAGIFLFYVQHQFEGVYWENGSNWDYADAAIRGSSFLKLPPLLRCTSPQHRLPPRPSPQRPNPQLQPQTRARRARPVSAPFPTLTIADGMRATRLKLWDEQRGRLVTFADARARA